MRTIKCKKCGAIIDASLSECPVCGAVYYILPEDVVSHTSERPQFPNGADSLYNVDSDEIFNTRELKKPIADNNFGDPDATRAFAPTLASDDKPAYTPVPTPKRTEPPSNQSSEIKRANTATVQDEKPFKRNRKLIIWAIALLALLTLVLTIMSGAFNFGKSDAKDKMDNVVGLTEETAVAILENKGLEVNVEYEYNKAARGTVIEQSIKQGKQLKTGQTVVLFVSSGPKETEENTGIKTVTVPSLYGKTFDQALYELTAAGLLLTTAESVYSDTVAAGTVISQNPSSGVVLNKGDIVTVTLSDGPEPTPIPNTFALTAMAGPGGNISPRGLVDVSEGDDASFTITPDDGFEIREVKVDGSDVGAVSSYTFTNITQVHSIYAVFQPTEQEVTDSSEITP